MVDDLSPESRMDLLNNVVELLMTYVSLRIGTVCSGIDIIIRACNVLKRVMLLRF